MQLKITAPDKTIFEWEVIKVNMPTENGEIWVLPWHIPLSTVVKPGIVKITLHSTEKDKILKSTDFLFDDNQDIVLSVWRWLLFVDGETILVVTSAATTSPQQSEELLLKNKENLEKQISDLKNHGSIEDLEKALLDLQKIHADLKLYQMKWIVK